MLLKGAKEMRIHDEGVLDNLGPARCELARGKRLQGGHVGEDELRLVEGADQVLGPGVIDRHLAAYGGVDHGEQAGGDLNQGDSPQEGRRHEARQVADDAAAQSDDTVPSLRLLRYQPIVDPRGRIERLAGLAGGNHV